MSRTSGGDFLFRVLWGFAFITFLILNACVFLPEWVKDNTQRCGLFFCCSSYQECEVVNHEILQVSLPWMFVAWLLNFLAVFSSKCKCNRVTPSGVRRVALMNVISGALAVGGATQFIVRMVANEKDLSFGPAGIISLIAGITLFVSGIFGFCHYSDSKRDWEDNFGSFHGIAKKNDVEPLHDVTEGTSDIYNIPPPLTAASNSMRRSIPLQSNTVPNNFASRFWSENIAVSKDSFTADVPYPAD